MQNEIKNNWQESLQAALSANKDCKVGMLLGKRIFSSKKDNKQEVLVVLSTREDRTAFGHIFKDQNKWISCLLSLTEFPVGNSDEAILESFRQNLNFPWCWSALGVRGEDHHIRQANSFDEAINQLIDLIKSFTKEICVWYADEGDQKLEDIYWKI